MFSWQIRNANLTDNSKIGDEFEQVVSCQNYVFEQMNIIHLLSWSCQWILHLRSAMKNTNTPLDGAYLADFGIDISRFGAHSSCLKLEKKLGYFTETIYHFLP